RRNAIPRTAKPALRRHTVAGWATDGVLATQGWPRRARGTPYGIFSTQAGDGCGAGSARRRQLSPEVVHRMCTARRTPRPGEFHSVIPRPSTAAVEPAPGTVLP